MKIILSLLDLSFTPPHLLHEFQTSLLLIKYYKRSMFCCTPWIFVTTPLLEECEDDTHSLEMGTWESFGTPETSEFDCRGQNTLPWSILYIITKPSKCRCWKWHCMIHLDIYSTSYGKKKGRESNWQFDS